MPCSRSHWNSSSEEGCAMAARRGRSIQEKPSGAGIGKSLWTANVPETKQNVAHAKRSRFLARQQYQITDRFIEWILDGKFDHRYHLRLLPPENRTSPDDAAVRRLDYF